MTDRIREAAEKSVVVRFLSRVTVPENKALCWKWSGRKYKTGYGQIWVDGKHMRAHRLSWWIYTNKKPPENMFVCHHCDVRDCVNPSHLFIGTRSDNIRDCGKKGRHWTQKRDMRDLHIAVVQRQKTHCRNGHMFSNETVRRSKKTPNVRICGPCAAWHNRKYRAKLKAIAIRALKETK